MSEVLRQGIVQNVGAVRVGLMVVRQNDATLSIDAPAGRVQVTVPVGTVVLIGDAAFRLSGVVADTSARRPGGSTATATLEPADDFPPRHPGTLAVPLGATASLSGFDLSVMTLTADGAEIEVWPDTFARADTRADLIARSSVKAGGTVRVGERTLSVIGVVASDSARGLQGWVELSAQPP